GYPEKSLAIEWPVGKSRVALAVIDLYTGEPIALFEVKGIKSTKNDSTGKAQLKKYLYTLRNLNIQTYLVYRREGVPPFEVQRIKFDWDNNE
ncbi:MAG: hypothetical protein ACYC21_12480, partial [Eubacteriales bacterium]